MWDGLRGGKGDLREKHGGGLGVGETEGRERGDKGGGRTWNHTTIYVRGDSSWWCTCGRYSGRRVEYYMEGVGDLRRGVCIIRD